MRPPIVLSIDGSDPSGGAGIEASLKTSTALGAYGATTLTCLTAQNTQGIQEVFPLEPEIVAAQLTAVLDDLQVDATVIGQLATAGNAALVAETIASRRQDAGFVVLDPVMVSTHDEPLLPQDAREVLIERLLPSVDIITPNIAEAALLLGGPMATDIDEMEDQAKRILELGPRACLLKGGHLRGAESVDLYADAGTAELLRGRRYRTRNVHGTGATLATAIAAQYARVVRTDGDSVLLSTVVATARDFLASTIAHAVDWELSLHPETGHGPVNHLITVG